MCCLFSQGFAWAEQEEANPDLLSRVWELPNLYENPENTWVQQFKLTGIVQWQYAEVDAEQGNMTVHEFRRFRFGGDLRFLQHFIFRGKVNFDPDGAPLYKSLSQVYLAYSPYGNSKQDLTRFRLMAGKLKSRFSAEQSISPKRIKTFERSLLANQLGPAKTTSVLLGGKSGSWDYATGILAGEWSPEFARFDNGALFLGKIGYVLPRDLRLAMDVLSVYGEQDVTSDISHAVSVSATGNPAYKQGRWAGLIDLLYGIGDSDQPNVFGVILLPSFKLSKRWECVGRYQIARSDGPNGLRLQKRYERAVETITDDGWGESYQAAYLGLTYYLHGDKLKLMTAIEYSRMDGGSDGGDFDGYTWFSGIRTYF